MLTLVFFQKHEYMQEMQKIESTADSVQKICQFTYLVDLTTAYIVREASIRRFLSRIGYSYDVRDFLSIPYFKINNETYLGGISCKTHDKLFNRLGGALFTME